MDSLLDTMLELLEQQKQLHKELLELSHEKRRVITAGDTARLGEIVGVETDRFSKLKSFERKRELIAASLRGELSIDGEVTLSAIIEKAQGEQKKRFALLQREFAGVLSAQSEINKLNKQLLETQLDYTETMLNIIVGSEDPLNNFYSDDGSENDKKRQSAGLFDRQI